MRDAELAQGSVKWFDRKKGFGFIQPDLGSIDVFVHISAVKASGLDALDEKQRVEFELIQMHDGRVAAFGIRPVPARVGGRVNGKSNGSKTNFR